MATTENTAAAAAIAPASAPAPSAQQQQQQQQHANSIGIIDCPHPIDVLMPVQGYQLWAGNRRYRVLVEAQRPQYFAAHRSATEQARIALEIVRTVQKEGGRFLMAIETPVVTTTATATEQQTGRGIVRTTVWKIMAETDVLLHLGEALRDERGAARKRRRRQRKERRRERRRWRRAARDAAAAAADGAAAAATATATATTANAATDSSQDAAAAHRALQSLYYVPGAATATAAAAAAAAAAGNNNNALTYVPVTGLHNDLSSTSTSSSSSSSEEHEAPPPSKRSRKTPSRGRSAAAAKKGTKKKLSGKAGGSHNNNDNNNDDDVNFHYKPKPAKSKAAVMEQEGETELPKGVTIRPSGKWQAQTYFAGQSRYVGVYDTSRMAARAYVVVQDYLRKYRENRALTKDSPKEELARIFATARKAADDAVTELIQTDEAAAAAGVGGEIIKEPPPVGDRAQADDNDDDDDDPVGDGADGKPAAVEAVNDTMESEIV